MKKEEFIHSSSRIRSLESHLLTEEDFQDLIRASDLAEAVNMLRDSNYAEGFNMIDRPEEYDQAISYELDRLYKELREISPYQVIIDIVSLKYEAHNLKVALKDNLMGVNNQDLAFSENIIGPRESVGTKDEQALVSKALEDLSIAEDKAFAGEFNILELDFSVDEWYYRMLLKIADQAESDLIERYIRDYIDFSNIIALLRMKRQSRGEEALPSVISHSGFIKKEEIISMYNDPVGTIVDKYKNTNIGPRLVEAYDEYQDTDSVSSFEIQFDNHQMDLAKEAKFISYGPEVIFAYLISREIEIKNIRLVLVAKLNDLSDDFAQGRLRETYA